MSSTVFVPCLAHDNCHSHNAFKGLFPDIDSRSHDERSGSAEVRGPSPLPKLPHELLLIITSHLEIADRLSLALTSRSLAAFLRDDIHAMSGKYKRSNWRIANDLNWFLRLLVRDLHERYWHCEACVVLHPRSVSQSDFPGLFTKILGLLPTAKAQSESQCDEFTIRMLGTPIYTLSFATARMIMESVVTIDEMTRCMERIRCYGRHDLHIKSRSAAESNAKIRYSFQPKITAELLLIKATYTWEPSQDGGFGGAFVDLEKLQERYHDQKKRLLQDADLWICHHLSGKMALEAAERRPLTREYLRCRHCPTQYWVEQNDMGCFTELIVWHNFGPCLSRRDVKWMRLTSDAKDLQEYEWKQWCWERKCHVDEDISESFKGTALERMQDAEKERSGKRRGEMYLRQYRVHKSLTIAWMSLARQVVDRT